jgi:hypothetical protein
MKSKAFRTIPEAIHATYSDHADKKSLAADLDYSPSNLSQRTSLSEDAQYPFPATDRLIRLQEITGNVSILLTMADRLGFEVRPKAERMPELVEHLTAEARRLNDSIQLVLSTPWVAASQAAAGGRRK